MMLRLLSALTVIPVAIFVVLLDSVMVQAAPCTPNNEWAPLRQNGRSRRRSRRYEQDAASHRRRTASKTAVYVTRHVE